MSRRRRRGGGGIGDHPGAMIFGAIIGAVAGSGGAFFYTPWSGPALRERLFGPVMNVGGTVAESVGTAASPVVATVGDVAQKGKVMVAPAAEKVSAVARKGVEAGTGAVHGVTEQVQVLANRRETSTEEVIVVTSEQTAPAKPLETL